MNTFLIAARVFAFLTLLFVPSFAVFLLLGFIFGNSAWFGGLGMPVLLVNAVVVCAKPSRDFVWRWANRIAGTKARL